MNAKRLLTLVVPLVLACARAPAAPVRAAGAPADYFPLALGNSWTFLDRSPRQKDPVRRTIRIVARDAQGYFVDDQRGALRADPQCVHDRTRRLLCGPLERGTAWSSVVNAAVERYEIAGVDELVTVPAGTFRGCVRVRSKVRAGGLDQVAEMTYAPGVGPVRLETFAVVKGIAQPQIRGELESFRLAGER